MEGICVNFLDQVQFFRFLKGRCHGTLSGEEGALFEYLHAGPLQPCYATACCPGDKWGSTPPQTTRGLQNPRRPIYES